jgi:hypothetical protein
VGRSGERWTREATKGWKAAMALGLRKGMGVSSSGCGECGRVEDADGLVDLLLSSEPKMGNFGTGSGCAAVESGYCEMSNDWEIGKHGTLASGQWAIEWL